MSKRIFRNGANAEISSLSDSLRELKGVGSRDKTAIQQPGEQIFKEAFATGFEAGFAKGLADAESQTKARLDLFSQELKSVIERIELAMELWYEKAEFGLAGLAGDVARRVIAEELTLRPDAILAITREALQQVTDSPTVHIRVNPFDLPTLEENRDKVLASAGNIRNITFLVDESLSPGSLVIESENGVVQASVESRVDSVLKEAA